MKVVLFTICTGLWDAEVVKIWAIEYWGHFGEWRNWPKSTLITEICKSVEQKKKKKKKSQMNKCPHAASA